MIALEAVVAREVALQRGQHRHPHLLGVFAQVGEVLASAALLVGRGSRRRSRSRSARRRVSRSSSVNVGFAARRPGRAAARHPARPAAARPRRCSSGTLRSASATGTCTLNIDGCIVTPSSGAHVRPERRRELDLTWNQEPRCVAVHADKSNALYPLPALHISDRRSLENLRRKSRDPASNSHSARRHALPANALAGVGRRIRAKSRASCAVRSLRRSWADGRDRSISWPAGKTVSRVSCRGSSGPARGFRAGPS